RSVCGVASLPPPDEAVDVLLCRPQRPAQLSMPASAIPLADCSRRSWLRLSRLTLRPAPAASVLGRRQPALDGDTNFSAQLTNIAAHNPDGVYIAGYYTEAAMITQRAAFRG